MQSMTRMPKPLDLPTLAIALAIYGGFMMLTAYFEHLPLALAAPLGAVLLAWHGSLQHETIHGHPTSSRQLNALLGGVPLSLWIPYRVYRETHLRHHRHEGRHLTDAKRDPESYYLRPGTLAGVGWVRRAILLANRTLAGRILLGPAVAVAALWVTEARKVRMGHSRRLLIWSRHALAAGLVLYWTVGLCHIHLGVFLGLLVYPSISLAQLRSFAEHRADANARKRTRVVESNPVLALLFMNNNLHIAHHAHPELPWHRLPNAWNQMRESVRDPALVIQGGYREVFRRYFFRPLITAEHPGFGRGLE
jgi:fatty acid desaturase